MEPTETLYNLENEISNWRQVMLNGALTPEDVDELSQHLRDEIAVLQKNGLSGEEAWMIARKRIGQPLVIEQEFSKVNPNFTASRNLLMLFWGGTIFMILQSLFFAFPNLLWFIVTRVNHSTHYNHVISNSQTEILLNVFSAIILGLVLLSLIKANRVALWFNKLITNYSGTISLIIIIGGSFVASLNYLTISSDLNSHGRIGLTLDKSLELLGIIFYGSLIFCTAWFTMRYRKQEFRNLKNFSTNITWIMSLGIGAIIEMVSLSGFMLQVPIVNYIISVIGFGFAGWLIANSKTYILNLFMVQVCSFYMCWGLYYNSANHSFILCAGQYSLTLLGLFAGFIIHKKKSIHLQPS